MKKRFENKSIIVTGAAGGIGLAAAQAFAAEGGQVLLTDIQQDKVAGEADKICASGGVARSLAVDISDYEQCQAMVAYAVEQFGGLNIAFNNAGIGSGMFASFYDAPVDDWNKTLAVNLTGVYYCMHAQAPEIKRAGGGAIVSTGSVASKIAAPNMPAYVAAKHGLIGLTKAAALDLIADGIRVNAICPGGTQTPMTQAFLEDPEMKAMYESVPIKRIAQPSEMAAAVLFLASDDASYIVGETINVDGGMVIE